jgi:hypothetical protein
VARPVDATGPTLGNQRRKGFRSRSTARGKFHGGAVARQQKMWPGRRSKWRPQPPEGAHLFEPRRLRICSGIYVRVGACVPTSSTGRWRGRFHFPDRCASLPSEAASFLHRLGAWAAETCWPIGRPVPRSDACLSRRLRLIVPRHHWPAQTLPRSAGGVRLGPPVTGPECNVRFAKCIKRFGVIRPPKSCLSQGDPNVTRFGVLPMQTFITSGMASQEARPLRASDRNRRSERVRAAACYRLTATGDPH